MAQLMILGAGGMGTSLAVTFSNLGHEVTLWGHKPESNRLLREKRENERLLKGIKIPEAIEISDTLEKAAEADHIIIATPSVAFRETLGRIKGVVKSGVPIVCTSKGFEVSSLLTLDEVSKQELPDNPFVALTGPSHAEEMSRGIPTVLVAASENEIAAQSVQRLAEGSHIRIYTGRDVIGAEMGGALKNVIAFAAGISDGMGGGDNTKAALMTRGLTEIARLGAAMGASIETFGGISGVGDLIVTCCSVHSRNRRCGYYVGEGLTVKEAVEKVGMTVEGITAAICAYRLAEKHGVEMPITRQIYRLIEGEITAEKALEELLGRPLRREHARLDNI